MKKSMTSWLAVSALATLSAAASIPVCAQTVAPGTTARPSPQVPAQVPAQATTAQRMFGDVNPKLAQLTDDVLFGDVWKRPGLSPRDRSLVTISALIAMNRPDQLRSHLQRARDNGVTEAEIVEAISHLAFYSGWPNAVTASTVAKEVFQKK